MWAPPSYLSGCSQGVWLRGDPVLVRNYDYAPERLEGTILHTRWVRDVIGTSDCAWGLLDGINDAGLAVSLPSAGARSSDRDSECRSSSATSSRPARPPLDARAVLARLPYHLAHTLTIVDASGDVCTAYLAPDRGAELSTATVATNHQGRVEWAEHASATHTMEREERLVRLLEREAGTVEEFVDAFLHPPLFGTDYQRRMGTLYTCAYHVREGRVEYRWEGSGWEQSFASFAEGTRTVTFVDALGCVDSEPWVGRRSSRRWRHGCGRCASAANLAAWDANVAASDETRARRVETELELTDLLSEPDLFRAVYGGAPGTRRTHRCDVSSTCSTTRSSRIRCPPTCGAASSSWRRRWSPASSRTAAWSGGHEVGDNEIKRILRSSDDVAERREAWEASKTVGAAVSDDVRELARLRNEAARSLGYRDWFALAVATMEMSEDRLFDTLAEADAATSRCSTAGSTRSTSRSRRASAAPSSELRPWHYADPFFQEVPAEGGVELDHVFAGRDLVELTRRTFDGLGLETAPILGRSDLYPRDRKSQHAFCLDVDREGDIRVLCNVVDDAVWMDTMLHELGHGVFSAGHDPALPWLLRDCHLTTTEGIAILMGRLAADREWLQRVAGLSADEAARARARRCAPPARPSHVVFARWVLVMTSFERALYGNPEADLDTTLVGARGALPAADAPDGRHAPDWAAKIHVACAPVYYHTYLYGAITASQLAAALTREAGGIVDRPAAGAFLSERLFRPGMTLRWDELLEQATGEPLASRYYAAEIAEGLAA